MYSSTHFNHVIGVGRLLHESLNLLAQVLISVLHFVKRVCFEYCYMALTRTLFSDINAVNTPVFCKSWGSHSVADEDCSLLWRNDALLDEWSSTFKMFVVSSSADVFLSLLGPRRWNSPDLMSRITYLTHSVTSYKNFASYPYPFHYIDFSKSKINLNFI